TDARFGDAIRLFGLDLDRAPLPSGRRRPLRLFWEPLRPLPEELSISLRLTRDGREWWRWDGSPAAHTYPTTYWKPGRAVRGSPLVQVPTGTPPGRYDLEMVVYNRSTGQTLPVQLSGARGGDAGAAPSTSLRLATLEVSPAEEPADPAGLPVAARAPLDLGGVELVGGEARPDAVDAGAPIDLALAWRLAGPAAARRERLLLVDAAGRVWPLLEGALGGAYPIERWRPGEVVVERSEATVPPGAAAGDARLLVAASPAGAAPSPAELARIAIRSRAHTFAAPLAARSLRAQVGELASLVGVDAPASVGRGEPLTVTLHWQARAETTTSYSVFVHLVGADDRPVAQRDGIPGEGTLPTTGWVAGEFLRDTYTLAVPAGLEPGEYRLLVGMYQPRTGQRLPALGPAADAADRVAAATVQVR
ncbi:MAG TPA: hypothetical protein VGL23_04585, partial [Chloroflexota bacterium]